MLLKKHNETMNLLTNSDNDLEKLKIENATLKNTLEILKNMNYFSFKKWWKIIETKKKRIVYTILFKFIFHSFFNN